jgi:hypothetical protein
MMLDDNANFVVTHAGGRDASTPLTYDPDPVPSRPSQDLASLHDPLPSIVWVNDGGYILDCCAHTQEVFGYWRDELKGQHISIMLPDLDTTSLLDESGISPVLEFLCRSTTPFRGMDRAGTGSAYAVSPQLVSTSIGQGLVLILHSKLCENG